MEEALPDRVEVGSKSSEESDSSKGNLWHCSSRCHRPSSISWAEEESEGSEEPAEEPTEEPMVEHPTLGQESLPKGSQAEEEVVIHAVEDEIDHLC